MLGSIAKFGQGAAFKAKWIGKNEKGELIRLVDEIVDVIVKDLGIINDTGSHDDEAILKNLKKRTLITAKKNTKYMISKGKKFTLEIVQEETDITHELLSRYYG